MNTVFPEQETSVQEPTPDETPTKDLTLFIIIASDHRRLDMMTTYASDEIQARRIAKPWLMQRPQLKDVTVKRCPGGFTVHTLLFPGRVRA